MDKEEFLRAVAELVAGMQVQVSMPRGHIAMGTAFGPWQRLVHETTGGFGWTNADNCEAAYRKLFDLPEKEPVASAPADRS